MSARKSRHRLLHCRWIGFHRLRSPPSHPRCRFGSGDHSQPSGQAFPSEDFYLPPSEVLQAELQRDARGHFNIIHQHSALRADCYLPGRSGLALWELAHRQRLPLGSSEAWFAPPESVIVHKLIFHREGGSEKHLEDIRGMLIGTPVDREIIADWVNQLGLAENWSAALADR